MDTFGSSDCEQNNIPPAKITENRISSVPPTFLSPLRFFELIGGPHDGMICYRNEEGIFVNGDLITERTDGATLKGHLKMPEWLGVSHKSRVYDYRMCMKRAKYIYGGGV